MASVVPVVQSLISLINRNIIAKTKIISDINVGDTIVNVENTFHFLCAYVLFTNSCGRASAQIEWRLVVFSVFASRNTQAQISGKVSARATAEVAVGALFPKKCRNN